MKINIKFEAGENTYDVNEDDLPKILNYAHRLSDTGKKGPRKLYMTKCDVCGAIKSFCTNRDVVESKCTCGAVTPVGVDLLPVDVRCSKCGTRLSYLTNIKDNEFETECFVCKAPINLFLNQNKTRYLTKEES